MNRNGTSPNSSTNSDAFPIKMLCDTSISRVFSIAINFGSVPLSWFACKSSCLQAQQSRHQTARGPQATRQCPPALTASQLTPRATLGRFPSAGWHAHPAGCRRNKAVTGSRHASKVHSKPINSPQLNQRAHGIRHASRQLVVGQIQSPARSLPVTACVLVSPAVAQCNSLQASQRADRLGDGAGQLVVEQ